MYACINGGLVEGWMNEWAIDGKMEKWMGGLVYRWMGRWKDG